MPRQTAGHAVFRGERRTGEELTTGGAREGAPRGEVRGGGGTGVGWRPGDSARNAGGIFL